MPASARACRCMGVFRGARCATRQRARMGMRACTLSIAVVGGRRSAAGLVIGTRSADRGPRGRACRVRGQDSRRASYVRPRARVSRLRTSCDTRCAERRAASCPGAVAAFLPRLRFPAPARLPAIAYNYAPTSIHNITHYGHGHALRALT
ncbi:hypothetical protein HYPSUDRAFT_88916 [Hypholoma sublateritium FD-334 SS-4]|uniref:Uncharacterized protein n=1 Tax=Hypholoma sublateritium (strain FD-334 SS-4) TaxID=945553 RepID=A0A0D2M9W5_HYPSF|nr:hypothetical protein HYPSUDRAFT_88916 [Hypholoma sublateritium FD-334 SS-4]